LRLGADDHVIKRFNPQEVVPSVNAVLHRPRAGAPVLHFENVEVDLDAHVAFVEKSGKRQSVALTLSEFRT